MLAGPSSIRHHASASAAPLHEEEGEKGQNADKASASVVSDVQASQSEAKAVERTSEDPSKGDELMLPRENAFPTHFAKSRGPGRPVYELVPGPSGELLADYVLFEESMKRSQKVTWACFDRMTSEERRIMNAHQKAVRDRKLFYKCPETAQWTPTVSKLLYDERCCGEGCRHCPYGLEACDERKRRSLCWNGAYFV